MELNGIANLKAIIQNIENRDELNVSDLDSLKEQVDILQIYMEELHNAYSSNRPPLYWHEVRDRFLKKRVV